jgi:hypothetical protein
MRGSEFTFKVSPSGSAGSRDVLGTRSPNSRCIGSIRSISAIETSSWSVVRKEFPCNWCIPTGESPAQRRGLVRRQRLLKRHVKRSTIA